ncbi:unnamed protein product [Lathyrus oleraceus]|uniref:F-box/kelch-repeat protein At3g23880-like n=1 Tax=Pisum sativum TaxID=3888 RepID=UPI0021CEAFD0|nr:F-box/kelch-repeat protein At3g23880-like [Pisum sativum]
MNTQPETPPCDLCQSNPSSPSVILHDELIADIKSRLPVKLLMQMKCVCKFWKTLISHPSFIKMHLHRSQQNSYSYVVSRKKSKHDDDFIFVPFSVNHLLQNRSITFPNDPYYQLNDKDCRDVIGSCNGLVCLLGYSPSEHAQTEFWLRFWNPATRTISDKLGFFRDVKPEWGSWNFVFGYDNSTDTYKVVALNTANNRREVTVLSLGENVWRTIQSFPVVPILLSSSDSRMYGGVYFSCTVNWLGTNPRNDKLFDDSVIISLNLSTETYTQMLPPSGFEIVIPLVVPSVCVLMNSLCFYHDAEGTHFVIWRMTEFGNDKSWTKLLKLNYRNLRMNHKIELDFLALKIMPLHVSEDGDTIVFANNLESRAILYNRRTKRARKTRINKKIGWFSMKGHVESLVSTS